MEVVGSRRNRAHVRVPVLVLYPVHLDPVHDKIHPNGPDLRTGAVANENMVRCPADQRRLCWRCSLLVEAQAGLLSIKMFSIAFQAAAEVVPGERMVMRRSLEIVPYIHCNTMASTRDHCSSALGSFSLAEVDEAENLKRTAMYLEKFKMCIGCHPYQGGLLKLAQPSSIFTKCIENSDDGTTHPIPATSTFLKLKVFFVNFPIQGKCLSLTICQMS
ncbi:unnamed protein product [Lactuca virosa]|uniref:Uncharacterized protein n=1 Tax=Lactuca virosa TaxID=75947 RepID=A0AAU9N7X2_9ASTR|nr:unnamed protein product [Lactuca virosa]